MSQPQTPISLYRTPLKNGSRNAFLDTLLDNPALLLMLFALQAGLGLALRESGGRVENLYPILVIGIAVTGAFSRNTPLIYTAYSLAYITSAEVLWRMTASGLAWNSAKFAVIALCIVATVTHRKDKRIPMSILFYFLCLIPGTLYSLFETNISRDVISQYLSTPAALLAVAVFFNNLKITKTELRRLLLFLALPTAGIAMIVLMNVQTLDIVWTTESNNLVAGFGANQVSTALGLGIFALTIISLNLHINFIDRVIVIGLVIILAIAALYTFSRGGVFTAVIASFVLIAHNLINKGNRLQSLLIITVGVVIVTVIFPRLDQNTNNRLEARYSEVDATGRTEIASNDIELFLQNPLTGVGLGLSPLTRLTPSGGRLLAHTEYTRMMAEHGVLGLMAIFALTGGAIQAYRKQTNNQARSIAASSIVWAAFYMTHAAMRTVAPAFMLGYIFSDLSTSDDVKTSATTVSNT
jgi:O-antigen ligase